MDEKPFTGKYWDSKEKGVYTCAACGNELFSSKAKFDSGSGWASFREPIGSESLEVKADAGVACRKCGSHLGGRAGNKDKHYRLNSMALDFEESEESALVADAKDELQGMAEDKLEEEKGGEESQDPAAKKPAWSLKNALLLLGAVGLGAGLGAGISTVYTGLMCQIGPGQGSVPAAIVASTTITSSNSAGTGGSTLVPPRPTSTRTGAAATTVAPPSPAPTGSSTGTAASSSPSAATGIPGSP